MTRLRKMMLEELQRRNFSEDTIRHYIRTVEDFARHFNRPPDRLGPRHIREYQAELFQKRKLSSGTVTYRLSALRFFYIKTLRKAWSVAETPYPRKNHYLPAILSQEEVTRLIDAAETLFHRTLLMTLYATGLRRAEVTHLKISDIDSKRMVIHVHAGKGRKDRDVMLSSSCSKNCASTGVGYGEKPVIGSFPATVGMLQITRSTQKRCTTPPFRGKLPLLLAMVDPTHYAMARAVLPTGRRYIGRNRPNIGGKHQRPPLTMLAKICRFPGGTMRHRWIAVLAAVVPVLLFAKTARGPEAQTERVSYAQIGFMRALDESHTLDLEAGYIRHLEWHRQAKDPFNWYSYLVWASTQRQRWIIYATFGHTAAELSNPVSPAEDWRDAAINILPHVQFLGSGVYQFLPTLSRGNGVPTPTLRAEYTTVELNYGAGKAFEAVLAAEQSKLQSETLWYRLAVGGSAPTYVRLRPRASLASILDERADQALPDKANGLVSKMTVEALILRPDMLVNVRPMPER